MAVMLESDLAVPLRRGKVRDIYDLGEQQLIVTTNRVSAFDVVLPTGIPKKGCVLTQMSAYWCEATSSVVPIARPGTPLDILSDPVSNQNMHTPPTIPNSDQPTRHSPEAPVAELLTHNQDRSNRSGLNETDRFRSPRPDRTGARTEPRIENSPKTDHSHAASPNHPLRPLHPAGSRDLPTPRSG